MKRVLLFLVFAFYLTAQGQNNQYNGTERWYTKAQAAYNGLTCVFDIYYNEYFTGSVVENGNLYYKVERSGYHEQFSYNSYPTSPCPPRASFTGPSYLSGYPVSGTCMMVRYDQKKIYVKSCQPGTAEMVYLDFNLQVGDTIKNVLFVGGVVTSIDSVLVNGSYLKRFYYAPPMIPPLHSNGTAYVIEKIGSAYGFLEEGDPFEYVSALQCFGTLTTTYYSPVGNCDMAVGINEQKGALADLQLFPNPSAGNLNFRTAETDLRQLRILNALGQQVYQQNKPRQEESLDLSFLSPGFYFLELETSTGKGLRKFVRE